MGWQVNERSCTAARARPCAKSQLRARIMIAPTTRYVQSRRPRPTAVRRCSVRKSRTAATSGEHEGVPA
eukprot:11642806-Alexandrium_andersonii.AAC.1